jgi:2-desacetyl-2-hydroxyethyl bacteriochlorophyllide A dehydrogenase
MKAAVLEHFGVPLAFRDVPIPEPGPGEILVRVRAAGICRTDLKIVDGAVPTVSAPVIPGHEPAGEVAQAGPGVVSVAAGDRVAVCLDVSCGNCAYCRDGLSNYCANLRRLGFERDGALAEYLVVPAINAVPLGDDVPFEIGATIPDAVGSSYHAVVTRARVRLAQTVVVYGLGGLGLVAVQVARLAGARVVAVARDEGRRRLAEELGASWSFDPDADDVPAVVSDLTDGIGAHAVLDFVGIEKSIDIGVRSCRKGGKLVVVGYTVPELVTGMAPLVLREIGILGSRGSTRADLNEAAGLVSRGAIRPVVAEQLALEQVNDGLEMLRSGAVTGRLVVRP